MKRREDLQGVRALAIISVVGFHFYPKWFPNGYLGVDQFFVLSGFLMRMLLKTGKLETFYWKRFKRILPPYVLVISISLIALFNCFPSMFIETNKTSALSALFFVSNRPATVQDDYFRMLSNASNMFTHTWSLSVEVQFYLIVPLFFTLGNKLPSKLKICFYSVTASISYFFFVFCSPTVSFYSVFTRIWQFLLGMIVHILSGNEYKNKSHLLLFFSIVMIFFPMKLPEDLLRPFVTVSTGLLILVSQENKLLSNKFLGYIGNISYCLYLVHWPVYCYCKLTFDNDQIGLLIALLSSLIFSVIIHELFEKWYLRTSPENLSILVIILFSFNLFAINGNYGNHYATKISENMTIDDAAKLNHQWNIHDIQNLFNPHCTYEGGEKPFGWCRYTNVPPNGNYKMMIIGNSLAANHGKMFEEECGYKSKSILQGAAVGCEPLFPSSISPNCAQKFAQFEERIRIEQPDYVFILTRFISIGDPSDTIYQVMREQMKKMTENIKRKLFILDALPRINERIVDRLVGLLKNGTDPVEIDKKLINTDNYLMARERHARLLNDCGPKCSLIDYLPHFYNKTTKTVRYYDGNGFSYWTTGSHLTPHGLELIRTVWTVLCASL